MNAWVSFSHGPVFGAAAGRSCTPTAIVTMITAVKIPATPNHPIRLILLSVWMEAAAHEMTAAWGGGVSATSKSPHPRPRATQPPPVSSCTSASLFVLVLGAALTTTTQTTVHVAWSVIALNPIEMATIAAPATPTVKHQYATEKSSRPKLPNMMYPASATEYTSGWLRLNVPTT